MHTLSASDNRLSLPCKIRETSILSAQRFSSQFFLHFISSSEDHIHSTCARKKDLRKPVKHGIALARVGKHLWLGNLAREARSKFFFHIIMLTFSCRYMRLQNTQLSSGGIYITPNSPNFNEERSVLPRKKLLLWAVWLLKEGHSTGANLRKMEHLQISKHLQMQNKFSPSYRHS